jgi:hypothetical protein
MQELIGHVCRRHTSKLKNHYSYFFGRRDENGEPFEYADGAKETIKHVWKYLHDLEIFIRDLDIGRTNELLSNDELRV